MLYNHRRGITGISLIIAAVIGLLILTVVIFTVGKNVGNFVTGKDKARTCAAACGAVGSDDEYTHLDRETCEDRNKDPIFSKYWDYSVMPGTYSEVPEGNACCCIKNK